MTALVLVPAAPATDVAQAAFGSARETCTPLARATSIASCTAARAVASISGMP